VAACPTQTTGKVKRGYVIITVTVDGLWITAQIAGEASMASGL